MSLRGIFLVLDTEDPSRARLRVLLVDDTRPLARGAHARLPMQLHLAAREEAVDLLEAEVLGLRVEEVDEGHEEGVEDAEVDVGAPANVPDADGGDLDDEEGEDPVGGGGERGGAGADGQGRVLGRQQPGDGEQADGEEEVEEEEHDDGDDAGGHAAVGDGAGEDGHAGALAGGGEEHELAAAEAVDDPDGDEGREEVGDAVEAGEEQGEAVRHADGLLKDDRGVLVLLHELASDTQHGAVEELLVAVLEHHPEAAGVGGLALLADGGLDLGQVALQLGLGLGDGAGVALDGPEDVAGLVVAVVGDEPAGRLGEDEDAEERDDGEEDLQGEGEAELGVVGDEAHAGNAKDVDGQFDGETAASVVGFHQLRMPHGCVKTSDNAAHNHLRDTKGGGLQGGADAEDDAADHDAAAAAEALADEQAEDGAEEAADLVDGDDGPLQRGAAAAAVGGVDLGERAGEGVAGEQAGHDALVVAEEEEAGAGGGRDGPVEGPADEDGHDGGGGGDGGDGGDGVVVAAVVVVVVVFVVVVVAVG
ncbi:hypothetical protein CTA1_1111 [Colletotrichum tanaceti]|uniref:Uncharacterized protein n=1 Tax=Colletotrichum tanaceti TaxID=1306861 RepID=A0A4U6X8I7_9PEZI|nr:hypothetical protein CTA1_1111 [Colletotrichum tanaceti]